MCSSCFSKKCPEQSKNFFLIYVQSPWTLAMISFAAEVWIELERIPARFCLRKRSPVKEECALILLKKLFMRLQTSTYQKWKLCQRRGKRMHAIIHQGLVLFIDRFIISINSDQIVKSLASACLLLHLQNMTFLGLSRHRWQGLAVCAPLSSLHRFLHYGINITD